MHRKNGIPEFIIFDQLKRFCSRVLVKNNKIKKDKDFEFVTMYKWVFCIKSGKIPNLHQLDNTTNGLKSKYLF